MLDFMTSENVKQFQMKIILLTSLLLTAVAVDRKRLATFPKPAANFDLKKWSTGIWYHQARYPPCSFSGSSGFSNIRLEGRLHGNHVTQYMTWRDGVCTNVIFRLDVLDDGIGNFIHTDTIGGMTNGDQVNVVYNPQVGYDINWGCTKRSLHGDCSEPWVAVKTRDRFPGVYVWQSFVRDLRRLFDLSLKEMLIVSQRNRC